MSIHTFPRPRWALILTALLVATLLPALGPAAPAFAAACGEGQYLEESGTGPLNPGTCDDVVQPDTEITKMTPRPNGNGLTKSTTVTFEFKQKLTDADTGPWTFMCKLDGPNPQPFEVCRSPHTYNGLSDTSLGHTFSVYAIDEHDAAINYTDGDLFAPYVESAQTPPVPDDDSASPAKTTWKQDTVAPNTRIDKRPYDEENPKFPMVDSRNLELRLYANEGSVEDPIDFECKLDDTKVPCAQGAFTLKQLTPGNHKFSAFSIDRAGNVDDTPDQITFAVPHNLTAPQGSGWVRRRSGGYFARDYLESKKVGATVSIPGKNVKELRLIAPKGPNLGKVELRIGTGIWRTVSLRGKTYERFHVYIVRDQFEPLVSGRISVRVKSVPEFGFARVDAVLAH